MAEKGKFQDVHTPGQVCLESFSIFLVEGNKKMQFGICLYVRIEPTSSLQEYEVKDPRKKERGLSCSSWVLPSIGIDSGNSTEVGFCVFWLRSHLFACLLPAFQVVFSPGEWPFSFISR